MNLTERDFEQNEEVKELYLNPFQKRFVVNLPFMKNTTNVGGRGIGKSTIIAWLIWVLATNMPRSKNGIAGSTYSQLVNDTLPGTLEALEALGYVEGKNLVFCEAPPSTWGIRKPKAAPLDFSRFITLYTPQGMAGFQLLSQDRKANSGRGISFDSIIVDEWITIDEEKFQKQVVPTKRGLKTEFEHHSYYKSTHKFSSMPYGKAADGLLKSGEYYLKDGYDYRALVSEVIKLEKLFLEETDVKIKLEIWAEILERKKAIRWYIGPGMQFYHEGDSFDNIRILGLNYIQEAYNEATIKDLFFVEYLNELITAIEGGFYAGFNKDIHTYPGMYNYSYIDSLGLDKNKLKEMDSRWDEDCIPQLPLEIGLDFGSKINCAVVSQTYESINRINILKDFSVITPQKLFDLAEKITHYYRHHENRHIDLYPDAQGNDETIASKETWTQQFMGALKESGWEVVNKSQAMKNPYHHQKHLLIGNIFRATELRKLGHSAGQLGAYPDLYINANNCKALIYVLESTGSIDEGKGIVRKDKSSERNLPVHKQEEAAHLGDALDQIIHTKYSGLLQGRGFGFYALPRMIKK
ncbi:terminase family protein [Oscillatoria amoena NRMC-F 0135]|nr:terminase family protein [Oscillatoria amoena NRMC-F 0135]